MIPLDDDYYLNRHDKYNWTLKLVGKKDPISYHHSFQQAFTKWVDIKLRDEGTLSDVAEQIRVMLDRLEELSLSYSSSKK